MSDPYVREIGRIEDLDGAQLRIGVDYDAIDISGYRLDPEQLAPLMDLIVKAARQGAADGAERKLYADPYT